MQSSILIYDQLLKIEKEVVLLANVKSMIQKNSKEAFESEHFLQIGQETLIDLLSLDQLNIAEIELLVAVSKWVNSEAQRRGLTVNSENRRKVFEPIKSYILFTTMTPERIADCNEVVELLTPEERGSVLLHQLNKTNALIVEPKTSRRDGLVRTLISVFVSNYLKANSSLFYSRVADLKVNRRVAIRTLYCTYYPAPEDLSLEIRDSADVLLDLKMEKKNAIDGRWCCSFDPPLNLKPYSKYTLRFTGFGSATGYGQLSNQKELRHGISTIFSFSWSNEYSCHCVRGFDFYELD